MLSHSISEFTVQHIHRNDGSIIVNQYENEVVEILWERKSVQFKVELQDVIGLRELMKDLGKGKELPVYISTIEFLRSTPEANQYASTEEASKYTLANAVLVDNLAKRILFNFFLKFNSPQKPTRGFKTRKKAMKWLLELKNQSRV